MNNLLEKSHHTLRDKRTVKFALEDSLDKINKKIVVKFQEANASSVEYRVSSKLFETGIPNFIKYYCSFMCLDTVKKYINMKSPEYICSDNGDVNMGYIVMPLYKEGSVAGYAWTIEQIKVFKSVIKQVVVALATAFIKTGFVHEDLHVGNILTRKTKKTRLDYDLGMSVHTEGMYAIIMDFQKSSFSHDVTAFKRSMRKLFGCLRVTGEASDIIMDNSELINSLSGLEEVTKKSISAIIKTVDGMRAGVISRVKYYKT